MSKNSMLQRLQHTIRSGPFWTGFRTGYIRGVIAFVVLFALYCCAKLGMGYYQLKSKPVEPFKYQAGYWKV